MSSPATSAKRRQPLGCPRPPASPPALTGQVRGSSRRRLHVVAADSSKADVRRRTETSPSLIPLRQVVHSFPPFISARLRLLRHSAFLVALAATLLSVVAAAVVVA